MTDNFNVSWPVTWSKFARKQIFIPKRLDSMFGRALVPGWPPFMNKVYCCEFHLGGLHIPAILGEQTECIKGNWKIENDCQCYFQRFSKK